VDRAHLGASEHATLGSTIPPARFDLAASTATCSSVRLYNGK